MTRTSSETPRRAFAKAEVEATKAIWMSRREGAACFATFAVLCFGLVHL